MSKVNIKNTRTTSMTSTFMASQLGKQTITTHILPNISELKATEQ